MFFTTNAYKQKHFFKITLSLSFERAKTDKNKTRPRAVTSSIRAPVQISIMRPPSFRTQFNWSTFFSTGITVFVSVFSTTRRYRKTLQLSYLLISKITKCFYRRNSRHEIQSCGQLLQLMIQPTYCVKTSFKLTNVLSSNLQKFMGRN